jgi:small acid-soluble spore protein H (minor)
MNHSEGSRKKMNFERAKEIFQSPKTIEVLYQGNPIWIEELDEESQTAHIHTNDDQRMTVPVEQLREQ